MQRTIATILLALSACGSPQTPPPAPKNTAVVDAAAPVAVDAGEPVEPIESLAARGANEIASMRESQRVADASKPIELKADKDICVRVLFAADHAVKAWLEDVSKSPRGDVVEAT